VEKSRTAGRTTDDSMAYAPCMLDSKATDTHLEYILLTFFHCNSGYTNTP